MNNTNRRLSARMFLIFRILFTAFVIATVILILFNSAESGALSENRSSTVTDFLNGAAGKLGIGYRFSDQLVRKLAHFSEYMLLGFWLMLTLRVYTRRVLTYFSWPLFLGLLTAVNDEFFQSFVSGRSDAVKDIVIDFGGILAGTVTGLFAILLAAAMWDAFHGRR